MVGRKLALWGVCKAVDRVLRIDKNGLGAFGNLILKRQRQNSVGDAGQRLLTVEKMRSNSGSGREIESQTVHNHSVAQENRFTGVTGKEGD